jgi:aromatic-L-amino-acid decarboxylase
MNLNHAIDEVLKEEETLDPDDWQEMRQLGHQMVEKMITYLQTVRERPVWQPVPEPVKEAFNQPLPLQPEGPEKAYQDFVDYVLPFPDGNIHPRFWGWVKGTGTPFGMLAEMLAAGTNANLAFGDYSAVFLELQVLKWLKEMLRYPSDSSGIFVSGGSMANFAGLAAARTGQARFDLRKHGLCGSPRKMFTYCSEETHSSIQKAVELLGLGSDTIRKIPVDHEYRIDIQVLETAIQEDKAAGHFPFCIVANAGTINTGAFDPIETLADICEKEGLWLHVDGAFGAFAALVPEMKKYVKGMERADSLAFDLHKWMYMPYEVGCVFIRDKKIHHKTFELTPHYLIQHERGISAGPVAFSNRGLELSKKFRGLKVWMSLKEHGIEKYSRLIRQNIFQAFYLGQLVEKNPGLELMAAVSLNIVCFRFIAPDLDQDGLNRLNKEILMCLHEEGIAAPSFTILDGKYVIRAAITNHRSRKTDFELLVEAVTRLGNRLLKE